MIVRDSANYCAIVSNPVGRKFAINLDVIDASAIPVSSITEEPNLVGGTGIWQRYCALRPVRHLGVVAY